MRDQCYWVFKGPFTRRWWVLPPSGDNPELFPTHAEAIAYADKLARTTKNGAAP